MIVDGISYNLSLGTMTIFIHKGGKELSICTIEITDRDLDKDEDSEYLQNLAEEIAFEQGYEFQHDDEYIPSSTRGDYSPSNPWDAPGMSIYDFI